MRHPLLATSADGVGTKVAIAQRLDKHDTIGFDLVGHARRRPGRLRRRAAVHDRLHRLRQGRPRADRRRSSRASPRPASTPAARCSAARPPSTRAAGARRVRRRRLDDRGRRGRRLLGAERVAAGRRRSSRWPRAGLHSNGYSLVRQRAARRRRLARSTVTSTSSAARSARSCWSRRAIYALPCLALARRRRRPRDVAHHRRWARPPTSRGCCRPGCPRRSTGRLGRRSRSSGWSATSAALSRADLEATLNMGVGMVAVVGAGRRRRRDRDAARARGRRLGVRRGRSSRARARHAHRELRDLTLASGWSERRSDATAPATLASTWRLTSSGHVREHRGESTRSGHRLGDQPDGQGREREPGDDAEGGRGPAA